MNNSNKWEEILEKLHISVENLAQNNRYIPEFMETIKELTRAQQSLERQLNFIAKKMTNIEKHIEKNNSCTAALDDIQAKTF